MPYAMGLDSEGLDDIKKTLQRLQNQFGDAVKEAVDESLNEGQMHSYEIVHVITGNLQSTIRTENVSEEGGDLVAGGIDGAFGKFVNYADIEEMGNSRREGHPYLRPGFEVATASIEENIKKKVEELL